MRRSNLAPALALLGRRCFRVQVTHGFLSQRCRDVHPRRSAKCDSTRRPPWQTWRSPWEHISCCCKCDLPESGKTHLRSLSFLESWQGCSEPPHHWVRRSYWSALAPAKLPHFGSWYLADLYRSCRKSKRHRWSWARLCGSTHRLHISQRPH